MNDLDPRLRALFELGDPAGDGRAPGPDEIARLRQRLLAETLARPRSVAPWGWVLAAGAALALVAIAWQAGRVDPPAPRAAVAAEARQIHFETPGGTRVIWVLRPASS
jgi:hypothetical protein